MLAACTWLTGADKLGAGEGSSNGGSSSGAASSSGGDGGFLPDGAPIGASSSGGSTSSGSTGQVLPAGVPVFYLKNTKATNMTAAGVVVGTAGPRAVGCERPSGALFDRARTVAAGGGPGARNGPYRSASLAMRSFEGGGATTRPSAIAFPDLSAAAPALLLATEQSECVAKPPVRIDFQEPNVAKTNVTILMPRFSPDGSRVAYIEEQGNNIVQVVSVSTDGAANLARGVRKAAAIGGNGGLWPSAPAWISSSEVAWLERQGTQQSPLPIVIQRGPDVATSTPTSSIVCNTFVEQIDVFRRGGTTYFALVASKAPWSNGSAGPSNVSVLPIDGQCNAPQAITNESANGFAARDVVASPNGELLAYASNADTAQGMRRLDSPAHVWLADSLGQKPPVMCSGGGNDSDDFGPQFVDGGRKVVWTHSTRPADQESIYVADVVDGRCVNPRALVGDDASRYIMGANAGVVCSLLRPPGASEHRGSNLERALLALAVAMGVIRRRRSTRDLRTSSRR